MTRRRLAAIPFFVTSLLGAVTTASAEDELAAVEDEFDAMVTQAVEHYEALRYEQAISAFQRAYEIRAQPELIYNIGRIYERSLQLQQALDTYQRFLTLPDTTADLRSRAANSLAAIRAEMAARDRAQQAGQSTEASASGTETGQGTTGQTTDDQPEASRSEQATSASIAGWALVGVGSGAVVAGIVLGALALSEQTATEEAGNLADQDLHLSRGGNFALSADVLFGVGGAMAVAGIALLIVRAIRSRSEASAGDNPSPSADGRGLEYSLTPFSLAGGGLGLSLGGTF